MRPHLRIVRPDETPPAPPITECPRCGADCLDLQLAAYHRCPNDPWRWLDRLLSLFAVFSLAVLIVAIVAKALVELLGGAR